MTEQTAILPAVAAAIFNDKGEILLQKRRDAGKWCVISGHVEFGETVEQAVVREIMEETDCTSSINRLIGVYSSPSSQTYIRHNRRVQYVTLYFEATLTSSIRTGFNNEETAALQFFAPDRLPEDMDLINPFWLKDALHAAQPVFIR